MIIDFEKRLSEFDHIERTNSEQFSSLVENVIEKRNKHFEVFRIDPEKDKDDNIVALSLRVVPVYGNSVRADMTLNELAFAIATDEANMWMSMRGCRPIPQGLSTRAEVCEAVRLSIGNTVRQDGRIEDEITAVVQEFLASVEVYQYIIAREIEIFHALVHVGNEAVVDAYDRAVLKYACGQPTEIANKSVLQ